MLMDSVVQKFKEGIAGAIFLCFVMSEASASKI